MLGVNQLDFINYCNALKGNYRKGVHKMETLLENPTHAKESTHGWGSITSSTAGMSCSAMRIAAR